LLRPSGHRDCSTISQAKPISEPSELRVHAALIAVQLMFASMSVVAKIVLRELPSFALVAARVPAAALILAVGYTARRERLAARDLPTVAVYALTGVVLNQLLFMAGLERTTATNAVVIGAVIPVFTVGVAVALGREAATRAKLSGLGVALCGALVVVGAARFSTGGGATLLGNLLCVANSLSFAVYLVISRDLLARYRTLTVVTWTFLLGAVGVAPFGGPSLAAHAGAAHAGTWLALAYIVIFPTVGTYFLNAFALKRAPASLVAIYIYVQPVVGALLAAWVLGERPGAETVVGGGMIAAGIWMVSRDGKRRAS
jgi:drug/metabolite transporter (DMT)-like permease